MSEKQIFALLRALLVHDLEVAHLKIRRVAEHDVTEVTRRGRAVDLAAETAPREGRQIPAMVDVRVGKNHRIHLRRRKIGKILVDVPGLLTPPLVHAAIQKNPAPVHLQQMLGPRRRTRRSAKMNFH